jgi:DNA-binding HxlR family transcriptional regulator
MERAGLIDRVGYDDGPRTHIRLTDAGRAAVAALEVRGG